MATWDDSGGDNELGGDADEGGDLDAGAAAEADGVVEAEGGTAMAGADLRLRARRSGDTDPVRRRGSLRLEREGALTTYPSAS